MLAPPATRKWTGRMKLHNPSFTEIISVLKEKAMPNPFCHVELNTTDVRKAKDFYGKLFNWKLQDMDSPGGGYTMIDVGEGTGGGMMTNPIPGAPSFWLSYVLVDDVRASTKKAASLGATVMKEVTPVPNFGEFSVITDPTGASFALWQPKGK
jgi:predicted enzyme related to lactoylglutathione lyase